MAFLLPAFARRVLKISGGKKPPIAENPVRIGLISAAAIAPMALCVPVQQLGTAIIVAVAARDRKRAEQFAKHWDIPNVFDTYDEIINSDLVDAVYIPLPNGLHFEWAKKALLAGKHVLLEKPSVSNAEQAEELARIASERSDLVFLEAFHYRFHPAAVVFHELVKSGRYGMPLSIHSNLCAPNVFSDNNIRFDYSLAGGMTMDMGTYAINAARWVLGCEPTCCISAVPTLHKHPQIDRSMSCELEFPPAVEGQAPRIAKITAGCNWSPSTWLPFIAVTTGTHTITFNCFVAAGIWHSIRVTDKSGKLVHSEKHYGTEGYMTYNYQLQAFVRAIKTGEKTATSWVSLDDTVKQMRALDMVYEASGLGKRS
ncbi:hypothetical protein BZG36_04848 [Bifiguratus adelaidae]|uniref:D-xylose 1-dehydrogenase (NADP(+), D-xylono-1,5-lactone-forming) n=1 Tax=Bifiguratus adelaidae TaxID=1938954 RepID=A0A261XW88_9FUNG|nr:hypothetical protein BZG36_04848 [Bifiguratus adelaidae]